MPFSFPQPRRRRIPWGYGDVHFFPFCFGARGGIFRLCALCAAGLMLLRVNSNGVRMSCERREQTPKGRDGAKPASQFKRSANELRTEGADPEGARRGGAHESTLTRMQAGRRFSADASFALSSRRFQRVLTRAEGVSPPQTRNGIFCGVGRINSCFAGAAKRRHCPRCLAARIARSRICALRGKGGIETPA